MYKRTKIVATIGPATETEEIIEDLINAGMDVARFNTKHGTPQWHAERIGRVRRVSEKLGIPISILLDLQGPEIRIDLPNHDSFLMKEGDLATFSSDSEKNAENLVLIPSNVVDTLQVGNLILLDDGLCELEIISKDDQSFQARALSDFEVKHRKTLNTPGITIDMPSIIESDLVQLDGATNANLDYVGLSFVRDKHDIEILRDELYKRGLEASVVAKIENQAAIDNIDEIIEAADAIMVARGDLAVEVPFEQLTYWQKKIIFKCRRAAKPVITATQMLKSMVDQPRPTRAEVSDVANAIYDLTSAVMLSEETTIGKYPVRAVLTQAKIAHFNEKHLKNNTEDWFDKTNPASVTHAAFSLLQHRHEEVDLIVCLTETGHTAQSLAKFRPNVPIHAVTASRQTYTKMSLLYGVKSFLMNFPGGFCEHIPQLVDRLKYHGVVESGQTVVLIYGSLAGLPGTIDSMSLVKI